MTTAGSTAANVPHVLDEVLGYLNFSSGLPDAQTLGNLSRLYSFIESDGRQRDDAWQVLWGQLTGRLGKLRGTSAAFSDTTQAESVLRLTFDEFIPAYRQFHRDLLAHQSDGQLWRPFFLGRVFEAILHERSSADSDAAVIEQARRRLDDFIGHRPVATLETQRIEPYEHEWVRPIPLFIRGAGIAHGRYRVLIEEALRILEATDRELLAEAYFDPDVLDELALDPRAYDFDHPVNKRPNYQFGQWDPHHIDNRGRYRRVVLQQVTLDALMQWVEEPGGAGDAQRLFEAAAALSGTILMASGTSGSGPDTHDSTTTLATLLPKIAAYRDRFYRQLVDSAPGQRGDGLRAEVSAGRQPLGAVRQHLNHYLARRRAAQLEHVHVALLFASMGYPASALQQAHVIPVAAARMRCEIQCRITSGHLALEMVELSSAAQALAQADELLQRAIGCGAMVDPWNILGFQGQFSVFPAMENAVSDHRIQQLVELLEQIFGLYARLWSEAAARSQPQLEETLSRRMRPLAEWWDQFAATAVESVEAFSGAEAYDSAREVAAALAAWHRAGAAAGDIAFWRTHVEYFQSPKAYALVVESLLEKQDFVAAMALLMQWVGQAGAMALREGEYSFHVLARRWLSAVCGGDREPSVGRNLATSERQALVRKFFDYLEANAEDFWQVPRLELEASGTSPGPPERDDSDEDVYGAAYDEMVYVDSTDDNVEGETLEQGGAPTEYELDAEGQRLADRLMLVCTAAALWKNAALAASGLEPRVMLEDDMLQRWLEQAQSNQRGLTHLLSSVEKQKIPPPTASRESLLEYDRRRNVKETLLENIVTTAVLTADSVVLLGARRDVPGTTVEPAELLVRAILAGDTAEARRRWPEFVDHIRRQALLYLPLGKGGQAQQIVRARSVQHLLRDLLRWLPRLGLLREACQVVQLARDMEIEHPVGAGAVSEFDRLFEVGYKSIVEAIVQVSEDWGGSDETLADSKRDNLLVEQLELFTESMLRQWLAHSRTLRLSALEKITDEKRWQELVEFVERYGGDLFTQRFLNLGNLRAILHQGVGAWLEQLAAQPDPELRLVVDLDAGTVRTDSVEPLGLILEAVAENYSEYRDYNSTTTQSDRGELLYTFLDFIRLRVQYDRVAWHLRPVLMAHEVLVRRGRSAAAELWRRSLAHRTAEIADSLQARYSELTQKYNMRLPTVADRLAQRFVRPLAIDRVRALAKPAMEEARQGAAPTAFGLLEQEIEELMQEPTGVGLEVPAWLLALEREVQQVRRSAEHGAWTDETHFPLAQKPLSPDDVQRELAGWDNPVE